MLCIYVDESFIIFAYLLTGTKFVHAQKTVRYVYKPYSNLRVTNMGLTEKQFQTIRTQQNRIILGITVKR